MNRVVLAIVAIMVALWLVPVAMGDNGTTQAGYGGESAVQVTLVQSSKASTPSSQTLPFTGVEIGMFLAAGTILVLVGLGMRRVARQRQ
jgi:hypothetical protein